ncbi:MAG: putative membrane protein [Candidatus Poriferisodalaceae bacterium]
MIPPEPEVSLVEPQRQSPLAILFLALRLIRNIGIIQIFVGMGFVLSRSPSLILVVLGLFVVAAIALSLAALGWWRYTFAVDAGELVVKKGVVSQDTLTVPLDRVQSVSIEQKLLHRLVGLVQVSLDTAGTATTEFTIDAVDRAVAVALQRAAADYRPDPGQLSGQSTSAAASDGSQADGTQADGTQADGTQDDSIYVHQSEKAERVVVRHDARRIIRIALARMPFSGLAFAAPLVAFGDDFVEALPIDLPELEVDNGAALLWFIPTALMIILVVSVIFNVIRVLLTDWNLTITSTVAGLRRDAGLLSTTSVAGSVPRVQHVEIQQRLLERFAHIQTTTLHNIGEGNFQVPGCDEEQAQELRSLALDGSAGVTILNRQVSPLEVFKAVRNSSVVTSVIAVGLWFAVGWWALFVLVLVPTVWLATRRQVRLRRWGIAADAIADRTELLGWKSEEALLRKVNGVTVRQSLFERKRDLATVRVQMAGSSISIGMVPLAEANAVRDRALYVAETDRRPFM